jgi:replicative DNA helicase
VNVELSPINAVVAAAVVLDGTHSGPTAWSIIESLTPEPLRKLAWPTYAAPPKGQALTAETRDAAAFECIRQLGAQGLRATQLALVEQLGTAQGIDGMVAVDGWVETLRACVGKPTPEIAEAELRERVIRLCHVALQRELESAAIHSQRGDVPNAVARIAQLQTLAAQIPGAQRRLPPRIGRAHKHEFVRTKTDRLISTGFPSIDEPLGGGIQPGDFIGLGARPSVGKSMFMYSLARSQIYAAAAVNVDQGRQPAEDRLRVRDDGSPVAVLFVSLEMSTKSLLGRFACDMLDMNTKTFRRDVDAAVHESELASNVGIDGWLESLDHAPSPFTIVDATYLGTLNVVSIVSTITTWATIQRAAIPDVRLLCLVDYFQHVTPEVNKSTTRQQALADVSRGIKAATKNLNVACVMAAQVGRDTEEGEPNAQQIRESGDLTADADAIWLLHAPGPAARDRLKESTIELPSAPKTKAKAAAMAASSLPPMTKLARDCLLLISDKQRDAETGWRVPLQFTRERARVTEGWRDAAGKPVYPLLDPGVRKILAPPKAKRGQQQNDDVGGPTGEGPEFA